MRNVASKTLAKRVGVSGRKSKVARKRKVTGKVKGAPSKITRRRRRGSVLGRLVKRVSSRRRKY